MRRVVLRILNRAAYVFAGALAALVIAFVVIHEQNADIEIWHEEVLDSEFTADSKIASFAEYVALEDRLFQELEDRIRDRLPEHHRTPVNRFNAGSVSDPMRWSTNWNRSFELAHADARGGAVLLHGMSDSPYSLRALGERLNKAGVHVLAPRMPGHGTAPSGLVELHWKDMAAAVRLAVRHVAARSPGRPLYLIGYSTGGALAVLYALAHHEADDLPPVDGIVLVSPAIGVTSLAAFAVWQARLGHLFGLDKLAWTSILPEYDPFKYSSFAVNAGDQVYQVTQQIARRLREMQESGGRSLPPILAFQSVADATVSTEALVNQLFMRLSGGEHELVLFDLNRNAAIESLFVDRNPNPILERLERESLTFTLSVLTNQRLGNARVKLRRKLKGSLDSEETPLDLYWPNGLYSLSHVALPFPADDPLYGIEGPPEQIQLGRLRLVGERGTLGIPPADLVRLRWNPFHRYLERRILTFFGLAGAAEGGGRAADTGRSMAQ